MKTDAAIKHPLTIDNMCGRCSSIGVILLAGPWREPDPALDIFVDRQREHQLNLEIVNVEIDAKRRSLPSQA